MLPLLLRNLLAHIYYGKKGMNAKGMDTIPYSWVAFKNEENDRLRIDVNINLWWKNQEQQHDGEMWPGVFRQQHIYICPILIYFSFVIVSLSLALHHKCMNIAFLLTESNIRFCFKKNECLPSVVPCHISFYCLWFVQIHIDLLDDYWVFYLN